MRDWDFTTLAYLWEYRNGAVLAGADKLDALRRAAFALSGERRDHAWLGA